MEANTPESKIIELLNPLLEGTDMFLTNLHIKPTNNIKLYLDAESGLNVTKSASINRKLYAAIEETGMYPDGDFSLEVSSPGIDEPLTSVRQYTKNIGRVVEVTPVEGLPVLGTLKTVTEEGISVEVTSGKKKEISTVEMPFSFIKKTIVQVSFK